MDRLPTYYIVGKMGKMGKCPACCAQWIFCSINKPREQVVNCNWLQLIVQNRFQFTHQGWKKKLIKLQTVIMSSIYRKPRWNLKVKICHPCILIYALQKWEKFSIVYSPSPKKKGFSPVGLCSRPQGLHVRQVGLWSSFLTHPNSSC